MGPLIFRDKLEEVYDIAQSKVTVLQSRWPALPPVTIDARLLYRFLRVDAMTVVEIAQGRKRARRRRRFLREKKLHKVMFLVVEESEDAVRHVAAVRVEIDCCRLRRRSAYRQKKKKQLVEI